MRGSRQLLVGLLMALLTGGLTLGSLSMSLLESGYVLVGPGVPGLQITFSGEAVLMLAKDATATAASVAQMAGLPAAQPSPTGAPACAYPAGWKALAVQPDQTLRSLAHQYGISVESLRAANCLIASSLAPGSLLYVPAQAAAQPPTATQCRPPYGWVVYNVRPGDTLAGLAYRVGQSAWAVQRANCLNGSYLYVGQAVYLPYYPPVSSYPTSTPWTWPTPRPTTWGTPTSPWLPSVTPTGWAPPTPTTRPSDTPVPPTNTAPPGPTDTVAPPPTDTVAPPPTNTSEPPTQAPPTQAPPTQPPPTDTPVPPPPPPSSTPQPPPTQAPPPTLPPPPTNTPGSFPYP